ncbi:MAG TPA: TolC family protein [Gemmatimonadales bacterium]|nr:TolC family protein [Gemmatimonadales bacterium]HYT84534.1 TolC family protein [Gemmatimonadales bacterium]
MRRALLSVGLAVCPALSVSQQPVPANLSLADAIALARAHNPVYRQALNDRAPAGWGVRSAYSSLLLPSLTASGGFGYAGPGQQRFLTSSFSQSVSTLSSNYSFSLNWELSGQTLTQPGLRKAELDAADAGVTGAETNLVTLVTQQYLTVLQARDHAGLARKQLQVNEESQKLARARYEVGRSSLIDVRQAQVARGQAEVALLRAQTAEQVEKLRLFQEMGVVAPLDVASVQLTDTFPVQSPPWQLGDLLTQAEEQNPALKALRARERAAGWGVRAATSTWGPSVSLSAGWAGFTQKLSDINPSIAGAQASATSDSLACVYANTHWLNDPQLARDCSPFTFTPQQERAFRDQNNAYPFSFTPQPFQARLTVTLPLWGNFQQPLQVSQAKAQHQDLQESVRARGLQVHTDVSQAYLTMATAYRAIAIQDTSRTAGREQLQLATERYRVGSGTFFELLDAEVRALSAETDYVNAVYDYHKAVAALEAAVGRPLR